MIDAIASEPQFLDHLAPIWTRISGSARGRLLVEPGLVARARWRGIDDAEPLDVDALRQTPQVGPRRDGPPALVASIGDIKIGRRLGYGPFAFVEHGAGQGYDTRSGSAASYAGGPDRDDNELFICPNEYSADRWRRSYPSARVAVVGSTRLDELPARSPGPAPVVAVSFHGDWPHGVPYGGNALTEFLPGLPALASRYSTIGHAHPGKRWGERMARTFDRVGIEFVPEFDAVCERADVYVCDNSSTLWEFASTGRPVVVMNARHWHRGGGPGLRFWDAAHVGVNVDRPDELVPAVARALKHRPEDVAAREDALEYVYAYRHGAAERAAAAVVDWLGDRERAVA